MKTNLEDLREALSLRTITDQQHPQMRILCTLTLFCIGLSLFCSCSANEADHNDSLKEQTEQKFTVEGRVVVPGELQAAKTNWQTEAKILLDYGKHVGFLRQDGSFAVRNVSSGSYILEVATVDFLFEHIRVDITNKGKIRARRLNLLQPNAVSILPYPMKLAPRGPMKYFRMREEWRVTDVLMNPMVMMLVAAFFLMVLMPKLGAQDPQVQKEMQNMQLPKVDMPDMADMLANMFGSSGSKKNSRKLAPGQTAKRIAR